MKYLIVNKKYNDKKISKNVCKKAADGTFYYYVCLLIIKIRDYNIIFYTLFQDNLCNDPRHTHRCLTICTYNTKYFKGTLMSYGYEKMH